MTDKSETVLPKLAIAGAAGRMGRQLIAAGLKGGFHVVGGSEMTGSAHLETDLGVLGGHPAIGTQPSSDVGVAAEHADVWIDFTRPEVTIAALDALKKTSVRAVIIGTTGFNPEEDAKVAEAAASMTIVKAGNFSVGVNVLEALTRLTAARLQDDWDIEILEAHHRHKIDAPSGTALMLGGAAAEGRGVPLSDLRAGPYDGPSAKREPGKIGFSVKRSGGIIGEHEVSFGSEQEIIKLSHSALDRSVFAEGALMAARWAMTQGHGLYGMDHVLGFATD